MTKRILVVEDQEDLRGVLRTLLTGSGYAMLEAVDGETGVARAKSDRPDLILMDIQMPVLDGYEATRRIKATPRKRLCPLHSDFANSKARWSPSDRARIRDAVALPKGAAARQRRWCSARTASRAPPRSG